MTEEYYKRLCEINVLLWDVLADIASDNYEAEQAIKNTPSDEKIISFADVLKNIKGGKKS